MPGIRHPVDRFASTGNNNRRSQPAPSEGARDRRRKMHQGRYPAQHPLGVVDQPDQLSKGSPATQIQHAL